MDNIKENKLMIIIWKWSNLGNNSCDTKKTEENDIIKRISDKSDLSKVQRIIEASNDDKKALVLYHVSDSVAYNYSELEVKLIELGYNAYGFGNGKGIIYGKNESGNDLNNHKLGLISDSEFIVYKELKNEREKAVYYVFKDNEVKQANFNSVWDHYMKKDENGKSEEDKIIESKGIKKKTNKLIQDLLPLAIDIQGLSEVLKKDRKKAQEYFDEIIKDGYLNGLKDDFKKKIKEINQISEDQIKIDIKLNKCLNSLAIIEYPSSINTIEKFLDPNSGFYFPKQFKDFCERLGTIA